MNARRQPLESVRVLLVEDNALVREVIERLLAGFGSHVTAVAGAAEALEAMRWARPDVLISDITMPDEDGCSLIRKIRMLPSNRGGSIPAVCLTGRNAPGDEARALRAGFQRFLAKPVDARRLVTMVADLAGEAARRSSGATPGSRAGIPAASLGRGDAADVRQQREEAR